LGEVRRNLAAYAGQMQLSFPRDAIQAVYVAGNGENAVLREKLQETLGIPVHGLDPFGLEEEVEVDAGNRAGFTGAVGLLELWATKQAAPVNFVKPRESRPAASPVKRRVLVYGLLGAGVAVFLAFCCILLLSQKQSDLERLRQRDQDAERQLKELQPEIKYLEALKEWNDAAMPWLDEIYDLSARAPQRPGFRITQVTVSPVSAKSGKMKFTARMLIQGTVPRKDAQLVERLMETINRDPHCHCINTNLRGTGNPNDQSKAMEEFTLQVDIARQPPSQYTTRLVPPPQTGRSNPDDDDGEQ
jgi:hypothetical protein